MINSDEALGAIFRHYRIISFWSMLAVYLEYSIMQGLDQIGEVPSQSALFMVSNPTTSPPPQEDMALHRPTKEVVATVTPRRPTALEATATTATATSRPA